MKMENQMKLLDLLVWWNQRFRKVNSEMLLNILYVNNKSLFFVYI